MATQSLKSLLGISDDRKEVEFNLNPIALSPTVRSGGNYNVVVQQTPKTNQAQRLADELRRVPTIFNQYTNVQKQLAERDAGMISGADAEEELQRLKKEEPETFLNVVRQRAYKNSLIEKHIRTQMYPKALTEINKSANARLYKNEAEYDAHVNSLLEGAWGDFTSTLGEDVANSFEGRAVWNTLTDNARVQGKAKYFESVDAVALENNIEAIESRFATALQPFDEEGNTRDVDVSFVPTFTKASINTLMNQHGLSRSEATSELRKMAANRVEILHNEGKHLLAAELFTALQATTSDDGFDIYKDNSETSLRLSRIKKSIDNAIEKDDEIDDDEIREYVGEATAAYNYFRGGQVFANLTPNQKELILDPLLRLDSTYTMEKLESVMAENGGTLLGFERALEDIRVNGSDHAQTILKRSTTTLNAARLNAQQIKGPPQYVRTVEEINTLKEMYTQQSLLDPDLTLEQFATSQNIVPTKEMKELDKTLQKTKELRASDVWSKIESETLTRFDAVFDPLEDSDQVAPTVTSQVIDAYAKDYKTVIEKMLLEEVESGKLTPENFEKRRDELIVDASNNLRAIITASDPRDILQEEANVPDAEKATQKMLQTVDGRKGDKTVRKPFQTLLSGFDTVKSDMVKTRAFGIFPKYEEMEQPWTDDQITADRTEIMSRMLSDETKAGDKNIYREALKYSLYKYGLDLAGDAETTMNYLEATDMDALDVQLFDDEASTRSFLNRVIEVREKALGVDKLEASDTELLEIAKKLGLIVDGDRDNKMFGLRLHEFSTGQRDLIRTKTTRIRK